MDYPRHRIYEAIADIKNQSVWRQIAPATPMTEADSKPIHAFCRMWSNMWGCTQHNLITVHHKSNEEAHDVNRNK